MATTTTNPLVQAYRKAETAADSARDAWNALPTPEARGASGIDLEPLFARLRAAARALLVDAAARHNIEQSAQVYLYLSPEGLWRVDGPTDDGYPLEGYENGAINEQCECDDDDECDAVRDAANFAPLPDAATLRALLNEYLGD